MLDRGKASRLLELATIQITEEAKRHSVQKRQTFDFTSTRFNVGTRQGSQLATPNVQLVTSEEFDALINDALEKLKDDLISGATNVTTITLPFVLEIKTSPASKLNSAIKTVNKSSELDCKMDKAAICKAESPFRTFSGRCNNLKKVAPTLNTVFERLLPPEYDDKVRSPRSRSVLGFQGSLL